MLGIFTNSTRIPRFLPVGDPPDCVAAAAAFSLPDLHWYVLGCHGNNVLLAGSGWVQLLVLNPMNGDQRVIPAPPDLNPNYNYGCVPECNAAVLCAAGHADHGCCQSCPFFVVCVFTVVRFAYATRYSSETSSWTRMASSPIPSDVDYRSSILIRNVLYWPLKSNYILAFGLGTRRLYHIECPPETHDVYRRNVHIMKTEDGGVGLASLTQFNLHLWAREADAEGVTGWVLLKVIELDKYLPLGASNLLPNNSHLGGRPPVRILGLVEDDDLVFIWTKTGVFAVQLKSMQFKKVFEADVSASVYPYTGFCIAGAFGCNQ
ncbi:hypothetical protein BAE44_0020258 [Dichanthelium oligosanthes]|uniref:F-box protein AT5G49610-like beta-propeller domain-containing protein n=1 Tax=Dichanthelium oligosanthes TaxID=888268 RepID=A0A1E5V0P7_9POAL|nr:hypothetical protein BAE44_0020258 [Dichanthelium oligosanthes]